MVKLINYPGYRCGMSMGNYIATMTCLPSFTQMEHSIGGSVEDCTATMTCQPSFGQMDHRSGMSMEFE